MKKDSDKNIIEEKKKPSFGFRVFLHILNILLFVFIAIAIYVLIIFLQMPSLDSILRETRSPVVTILDNNGREIRSTNKIMGSPVSVKTLPPYVWQSIISIEDKRYFQHGPIDIRGVTRAMISNLANGRIAAGGSSITQQTAKNIFLSRDKKMSRKIQEMILSYWLENRFDKNQILDLYMNRVSLVGGLRGIDAASRIMFGVPAEKLSIAQSAQIAAMLKAPNTYSPRQNPKNNIDRARIILKEMVRQKYITLNQAKIAARELQSANAISDENIYRYWSDFVLDEVQSRIGIVNEDIYVYTTLNKNFQEKAATAVSENVGAYQGAAIVMSRDGAILAMVGGADYKASQFNRTLAPRQPGSSFKPVVYLVALENGMTTDSIVNDSPFTIGDYNPKNYNEKYYGDIPLSVAFAKSVNSVPLKLTQQYGIDSVLSMAGRLGVGATLRREYSTVLGASEITLLDLTTMYDIIWNEGQSIKNYSIKKIVSGTGEILYERNPSDAIEVISPDTAMHMQNLMSDVVADGGTGHRANLPGVLGGKTGTSNNNRDAWFIGATDFLTIGVWVGNDDYTPMDKSITGGTVPVQIFKQILE